VSPTTLDGAGKPTFCPCFEGQALLKWPKLTISNLDRLYIIEGIATIVIACACFFAIPASYTNAWFLNESDKAIMRRRAEITEAYSGGNGQV
jgi:hypothetical protein